MLNRRWFHGRPAKSLSQGGVLARLFDPSEDPREPWKPCTRNLWCRVYGDRMPASLINKHAPNLYSKADSPLAGFLVDPNLAELYCAYFVDGSSMNKLCDPPGKSDTCTPGCPHGHPDAAWCQTRHDSQCGWHPERLDQMLMQQFEQGKGSYNELILGGDAWEDNLPHTVMAVFWPKYASYDQQQHARGVHQDFLRHYGLKWQQVPLVVYDPHAESEAFTLAARR